MIVSVRLQSVRSYDDASFELGEQVNIVLGPNASGKTSLLESLTVGLEGKSYKAHDQDLVRKGDEWARIDIMTHDQIRTCKLIVAPDGAVQKEFELSGVTHKRLSQNKRLPVVLFEPNHLSLFHGSPDQRRAYIDDTLTRVSATYGTYLRQYKRVLAQRNALLKQPRALSTDQLFVWNIRLSELGGYLVSERVELIESYNDQIAKLYSEIAGQETDVSLAYSVSKDEAQQYESRMLKELEKTISRDCERGFTGFGPHREDMVASIRGSAVGVTASRGEIRTLVLALKMLEAQTVEKATGVRPLLLLDDVFSELDGRRRQALVKFLASYQSCITTTDADVVVDHFTDKATVIAL